MDPVMPDDSSQPPGRLKDMGQKNSKTTKKPKKAPSAPSDDRDLTSDSSSGDNTLSKKKDYVEVADELPPQKVKDEDSACSLSYSNRSSDKSPEAECENEAKLASRLNLRDTDKSSGGGFGEVPSPECSLVSDDESDPGGEAENLTDLCQFVSHLGVDEFPNHHSISRDSANAQPSESLLTDDESDIDNHLVVNNRSLLEISSGGLPELSISARLQRGSISDISCAESTESSDESCEDDVPDETSEPSSVSQETPSPEPEREKQDLKKEGGLAAPTTSVSLVPPPVNPRPTIKAFYIPRQNIIPETKDATVRSTAFDRLKRGKKSKLFSNVLTDDTIWRVKTVEKVWKSFDHLSGIGDWQKLLTFGEPILMNFKLIELKSSFESIVRNTRDFASCSPIFEVLGEITRSKFEAHKAELFKELASPQFIHNLYSIIEKCHITRPRQAQLNRFVENFVDIYEDIFLQLDTLASDDLASDLEGLIGNCLSLIERGDDQSCADQLKLLSMIIESRDSLIRANSSFPFNVLKEESVESNIIDGPYDNVDQYLTVHYRLMKEDFQNSLRAGVIDHIKTVHGFRRKAINYNLNVFKNVTLASHLTNFTVKYKIMFYDQIVLAKLRDPASPHFLTGSLLMLTNTHFQDYSLVRVEDRSPLEREQNYIFVSMVLGPPGLPLMIHYDVMAEPSRLFEPYYRVLNVIRSIDGNQFPFMRYIVDVETEVSPPAFMKPNTKLKIDGYTCSLWQNDTWPAPENVGLNPVQLDGLKQALRNELAIIQGPPGTGKTYLSKKIIEVLLQNKPLWHTNEDDGAGLIMVVCFKNQSLDQLLAGLIKDKVKVLRIGTQSKEEMLDAYNLKTLKDPKFSQIYKKMRWLLADEQEELINNLNDSIEILHEITVHSGIIKLEFFSRLLRLSESNFSYLKANFEKWLLAIPYDEPDFRTVENVVGEQTWTGNLNHLVEPPSNVYQITLQDVGRLLKRVNAKLDVLKELGSSDHVDLLTSAANYLLRKQIFLEDQFAELKRSMTSAERLELYDFKKEFEREEQYRLQTLPLEKRWLLYKAWMHDLYEHHTKLIEKNVAKSQGNSQRYVEIEELLNMRKISQCDAEVVGLTTTAAAKYFKMMDCLKPKIVLVEEAAEVMEAHTVASLSKFCEHLILVGDHKQLRPLTSSHIIGKEAHLDYSLYERLVKNGFEPCTLNTQYRMRPDIADLIRPAVYKELFDDPSVNEYPNVLGIDANVYFVDHTVQENVTPDVVSRWNKYEAEFHLALCNYLVLQGYEPRQITILATYSEQEKYFNKEKLNYPHLDEVLMATVDSFQGKENDIILLSLVRSNAEAVIGFLAQENRINVALSRAKIGLFITGNKSNLLARDGLWTRVVKVLQKKKAISLKLPLRCQIHKKISLVAHPGEIKTLKNGGCTKLCKASLSCGHKCIHLCHPLDREHAVLYKCITQCNKTMECSHQCTLVCHSTNPRVFKCFCKSCSPRNRCEAPLPCGHTCQSLGHNDDIEHKSAYQCQVICNTTLPCGHVCVSICHVEDKEHQAAYKCIIQCGGVLICGHPCGVNFEKKKPHGCLAHKPCLECEDKKYTQPGHQCHLVKGVCLRVCKTKLFCGHKCALTCYRHEGLKGPKHVITEKCTFCSRSDAMWAEFALLRTDHPKGSPFKHCSHNVEDYMCDDICPGRPCGQPCDVDKPNHTCSDHITSGSIECLHRCSVHLACGHRCGRPCHLGDYAHECTKKKCDSSLDPVRTVSENRSGDENLEVPSTSEPIGGDQEGCVSSIVPSEVPVTGSKDSARSSPDHLEANPSEMGSEAGIGEEFEQSGKGHRCRPNKTGACQCQCDYLFECNHVCLKRCHHETSRHRPTERCNTCEKADEIRGELDDRGMEHDKQKPFTHCCHYKAKFVCEETCSGRLCGHQCGQRCGKTFEETHRCSDHFPDKNYKCLKRCDVGLTCGHKCSKHCHLGDDAHSCVRCQKKRNRYSGKSTLYRKFVYIKKKKAKKSGKRSVKPAIEDVENNG